MKTFGQQECQVEIEGERVKVTIWLIIVNAGMYQAMMLTHCSFCVRLYFA